jgi:heat shock protein HtpX
MTLYSQQSRNVWKTWALMSGFFVIVMGLGFVFSQVYGNANILYVAVFLSVAMNIASYWFSDKIVLRMAGASAVTREAYPELWNVTENLAITAGLPMPKLYVIADPAPNAFATGRDKDHSAVAVTTGLLAVLDRTELEGVIAHELAHIDNKDILLQTVVVILVGFVTLLSDMFLRMGFLRGGRDNDRGSGQAQMIIMIVGIALAILSPIAAVLIQLAISRKREFLADATAALMTRYPEGLASALKKISAHDGRMLKANHATAHLFISDPFADKARKRGFFTKLFMTHPPVEERVSALLSPGKTN